MHMIKLCVWGCRGSVQRHNPESRNWRVADGIPTRISRGACYGGPAARPRL